MIDGRKSDATEHTRQILRVIPTRWRSCEVDDREAVNYCDRIGSSQCCDAT
jgi:hypothetical protein